MDGKTLFTHTFHSSLYLKTSALSYSKTNMNGGA